MNKFISNNMKMLLHDFTHIASFREKFNTLPSGVINEIMKKFLICIAALVIIISYSVYLLDIKILIAAVAILFIMSSIFMFQWYLIFYTDNILIAKGLCVEVQRKSFLRGLNGNYRYILYFKNETSGTIYSCYIPAILYFSKLTKTSNFYPGKEVEVYFHRSLAKADGNSLLISRYLYLIY